jgi:hypothetical protein
MQVGAVGNAAERLSYRQAGVVGAVALVGESAEKQWMNEIKGLVRMKRNRSKDTQVSMSIKQARRAARQGRGGDGREAATRNVGRLTGEHCGRGRDCAGTDGVIASGVLIGRKNRAVDGANAEESHNARCCRRWREIWGPPATLSKRSGRKRGGNEEESWEKGSRGRGGWAAPGGLMTLCSQSLARAPGGSQRGDRPIAADCAKSGTLKLLRAVELFQGRVVQMGCGLVLFSFPSCICTTPAQAHGFIAWHFPSNPDSGQPGSQPGSQPSRSGSSHEDAPECKLQSKVLGARQGTA